jgi:hypothetical protein
MKQTEIKSMTDIKKGDTLLIKGNFSDGDKIQLLKVATVKVSDKDGTEIILKKKGNVYFNLGMYLKGDSWVEEVSKVELN